MNLRPYQQECLDQITDAFNTHDTALAVLATGTGKTIIFSHLIDQYCVDGARALVVAHKDELITQAFAKLHAITCEEPDVEKAGDWADNPFITRAEKARVIVTSVQTQNAKHAAGRRMERFSPSEFSLVVIDEAHHAVAATYQRLIDYYRQNPFCKVLGVTATPDRADEKAMGRVFTTVAYEYGVREAIADGWLVPIRQQFIQVEGLDFSGIKTVAGDFKKDELAAVMQYEKVLHGVVDPTIEIAGDRQVIGFASSTSHAERMCEICNRRRAGSAIYIDHRTPLEERRDLVKRFKDGTYQFLWNYGIATEGFDCDAAVIAMARPTKSRSLYCQMIGRGTRPDFGLMPTLNDLSGDTERVAAISSSRKPTMLVLDFVGNSGKHKLISTADVLGGDYDDAVVERAARNAQAQGGEIDMDAELRAAAKQEEEDARNRRREVVAKAQWKARDVNPFDVFELRPNREKGWHIGRPPTEKQRAMLVKAGVDKVESLSFTHASQIIQEMFDRRADGLCTYKQARLLARFGYEPDVTFEEASRLIDGLARNGWKQPKAPV